MESDEIARIVREEGEATRDDPMPEGAVWTRPNLARSVVFSVRLRAEELAQLEEFAEQKQLPPSTLVRAWILQRLEAPEIDHPTEVTLRKFIREEVRAAVQEALAGKESGAV